MKSAAAREALDVFLSALALVILSPVLFAIVIAILCETGRPVFFAQNRVGRNGKLFRLVKFRSMRQGNAGPSITARGDSRITRVGGILRKFKLDELPQFWNVVRGDMSIVGPRPEVPQFVDTSNPVWRSVLSVRPGITDPASVAYRNEEELLAKATDRIRFYEETILPAKLAMNIEYIQKRSLWEDVKVIARTAKCTVFPAELDIKETGV